MNTAINRYRTTVTTMAVTVVVTITTITMIAINTIIIIITSARLLLLLLQTVFPQTRFGFSPGRRERAGFAPVGWVAGGSERGPADRMGGTPGGPRTGLVARGSELGVRRPDGWHLQHWSGIGGSCAGPDSWGLADRTGGLRMNMQI